MARTRFFRLAQPALLLALSLSLTMFGCGGGGSNPASSNSPNPAPGAPNPPSSGGTGAGASSAPAGKFVYALDGSASQIAAFVFNPGTGTLTNVPGSPFATTSSAASLVATPSTQWVFVSDWMARTITSYKADPATGALTKAGLTSVSQFNSMGMVLDPNGNFLYVIDNLDSEVGAFAINADGSLTAVGPPYSLSAPPMSAAIDQGSRFLFVASDNLIFTFAIGSSGALTPAAGSPVTVRAPIDNPDKGAIGVGVAVDPSARFLFAPDSQSTNVWVYSIGAGGSLSQVSGSPFNAGQGGGVAVVDPSGRFLYDVGGGPQVAALAIHSDGSLTPVAGSPFDNGPARAGGAPIADAITDPQGRFLLLSDIENSEVTVFSIDPNSGALTNVSGSPFQVPGYPIGGGSPSAIAMTH